MTQAQIKTDQAVSHLAEVIKEETEKTFDRGVIHGQKKLLKKIKDYITIWQETPDITPAGILKETLAEIDDQLKQLEK